jgi:hypothetical protein
MKISPHLISAIFPPKYLSSTYLHNRQTTDLVSFGEFIFTFFHVGKSTHHKYDLFTYLESANLSLKKDSSIILHKHETADLEHFAEIIFTFFM